MKLCEECKKMGCLHTLCRTCFPKEDKPVRAEYTGWLSDNPKKWPQADNYIVRKGVS